VNQQVRIRRSEITIRNTADKTSGGPDVLGARRQKNLPPCDADRKQEQNYTADKTSGGPDVLRARRQKDLPSCDAETEKTRT